ncbi:helix-turn-helix transcriptional regulator [Nonomuraea sp. NPDC026600]|uniref:helix-turn-helix transcriptional regulator n=1 Tax=Nonomuraea sp. NPDC026600 TaxID=3155363 RepID=UPI00340DE29F
MNRNELAEFLRSRRARVTPQDVALPNNGRRRTPGLRRQEVAQLAGMSIDYYIRLEQGRGPHPSRQVLNALARALMLSQDERTHLFNLAGQALETPRMRGDVPAAVRHLIAFLEEVPAYVVDAKYEILVWNPLAGLLLGDLDSRSREDLNVIRWLFRSPDIGQRLIDEEKGRFARGSVADLRAAAGRFPDDPAIQALVAEMLALSPEFAELWARHEVQIRREHLKHVFHPSVGVIETTCQVLSIPEREDLRLVLYTTEPGSAAHQALRELRQFTLSS